MSDIITTLHPENDENTNLYPNIKKENIPNQSIDRTKLDDVINDLLNSINSIDIKVDTSTNILSKTTNDGIYVAKDNGKWYYYDSNTTPKYNVGGDFISNPSGLVYHINNQLKDENNNNLYPNIEDGQIVLDKISQNIVLDTKPIYHLIANETWESGYINPSGVLVPSTSHSHTDFIEIDEISKMWVFPVTGYTGLSFYDKNQNAISTIQLSSNPIDVPLNTRYIKVSQSNGSVNKTAFITYQEKYLNPKYLSNIEVKSLKQSKEIITSNNIFNKNTCLQGVYITSGINADSDFVSSDFIYVKGHTYITTSVGCIVSWFNENFVYQSVIDSRGNTLVSIPNTAYYCRLNFQLTRSSIADFHANFGNILLNYDDYKIKYILNDCLVETPFIVVDKNGNGHYKTITEAVYNAVDGDTIYIKSGNYENEIVKCWGKTIHLIGESRNQVIISNATGDYSKPPIEMGAGTLKNLTIIAKENSQFTGTPDYAIHIEDNNLANKKLIIENCTIISENNYALGMGMRGGCEVEFRNNDFITTNTYSPLFFHDASNSLYSGVQNLLIENCNFIHDYINGYTSMRIDSQEMDGSTINLTFRNNYFMNTINGQALFTFRNAIQSVAVNNINDLVNFHLTKSSFNNNSDKLNYHFE